MQDIENTVQLEAENVINFVRELYQEPEQSIYLHEPRFFGNEKKYLNDAIDSTFVSSIGAYVDRFEKMMSEIAQTKYAVAVVNGTAALHIGLKLVGVEENTEVLTQPLTFIATANAIAYEKAIPHFVDVSKDTLGLCPIALKKRLEQIAEIKGGICYNKETGRRISACLPMHTFGLPLAIDKIVELCNSYNIPVVEDAAESLGSYYKGKHTGGFGQVGTFSFNGNKTVTCGGGGAIVTNDEELAKRAKHITTTAKVPHIWEYSHDEIGYNYRMPNINAALACAQLEQLEVYLTNKRVTSNSYSEFFSKSKTIKYIKENTNSKANYWLNAIQLSSLDERNQFLKVTSSKGIMCRPIWKLLNSLEMYSACPSGPLENSKHFENTIVNLPSSVRV